MTCTGWTWEQVREELDIPRVEALLRYWEEFPPTHIVIKKISLALGIGTSKEVSAPTVKSTAPDDNDQEMAALLSMLSPG